jgi:hypothetical protein
MSSVAIPTVHAEIVRARLSTAKRFAGRVLAANMVADVRALLEQRYKRKSALQRYLSQFKPGRAESPDPKE